MKEHRKLFLKGTLFEYELTCETSIQGYKVLGIILKKLKI